MINIRQSGGGGIGSYIVVAKQIENDLYEFEGDYVKMVSAFVNAEDVYLAVQEGNTSFCISLDGTYVGTAKFRDEIQCEDVSFSGLYTTDTEIISFTLTCNPVDRHQIMMRRSATPEAASSNIESYSIDTTGLNLFPDAPDEDGDYVFTASVLNGVKSYQ